MQKAPNRIDYVNFLSSHVGTLRAQVSTSHHKDFEKLCVIMHQILKEYHGLLDRHKLMLEACEANSVSQEDYIELGKAGLGTCLLAGLPDWLVAYSAHLVVDFFAVYFLFLLRKVYYTYQ